MPRRIAAAAMLAALAASCAPYAKGPDAPVAASGKPECFQFSQIDGYSHAGRNTIRVSTGPGETWEFETLGICPDLDRAETLAFDAAGPGTICRGIDIDLIVPSDIGPRRCPVKMIRKLDKPAKAGN